MLSLLDISEREGPLAATRAGLDRTLGAGWEKVMRPARLAQVEMAAPMTPFATRALLTLNVQADEVARPTSPTPSIHGRDSVPIHRVIGAQIAELRPGASDLFLDNAGHVVHIQQAALVNEAIRRFFAAA